MAGREEDKDTNCAEKMKDTLGDTLEFFNKSVKDYLRKNLQIEGEEIIANKIWIHLGAYSETDFLDKYRDDNFSFVMDDMQDVSIGELKNEQWWRNILGTDRIKLVTKRVNNSLIDGYVGGTVLVLVGEIVKKTILLREKLLLEVIMDILSEIINDIQDIKEIEKLLNRREQRGYISLIKAYTAKVFKYYKEDNRPMLEEKDCIQLSHEKYEGREWPARIYIGAGKETLLAEKRENGEIICWKNNWEKALEEEKNKTGDDRLNNRKIRYYRKMMELCKNGKYLITCFNEQGEINIFGVVDQKWLCRNGYTLYIDFKCNGEWYIKDDEKEVLCYIKGIYYYSKPGMLQTYETKLGEEADLESGMEKKFSEIIEGMSKQEHGAGMIIAEDADMIAEDFCVRYNRGTVLDEKLDLTDSKNREFLLGMTAVDGMLLVDKKGICHAFGVILDGKAEVKANPARGSRYNSAVNYIYDKKGSCAVIISEDKSIDIIGKSIWGKEEQDKPTE